MDDAHFLNAPRSLAFNPVRAPPGCEKLPKRGRGRARALNLQGRDDALVGVGPAVERAARFADLLEFWLTSRRRSTGSRA